MEFRNVVAVLLSSAALVACNGWPRAMPLAEAERKPEKYQTYAATAADQVEIIAFENRRWMVSPTVREMRGARFQPVGSAGKANLYAQSGTQSPYGVLFVPAGGTRYRKVEPID